MWDAPVAEGGAGKIRVENGKARWMTSGLFDPVLMRNAMLGSSKALMNENALLQG